ncbi:nuclear transport factor 2 family protein [Citricoccus sp. GCM10030269]|uniref:nuclear transport factor 2 family protein n=1 Tax=Citricoccus sp. GCM10030269 TaxID=3273388 RepID=UPI003621B3A8
MEQQQNSTTDLEDLARRVAILEAQQAVRTLQHQYGYYLDKCLYQEVVDLFADDGSVFFCGAHYLGKEGVRRLYVGRFRERFTDGLNGPVFGFLLDHPQHQDVVTVSDDGQSARARFRSLMQAGLHEQAKDTFRGTASMEQWFEGGLYENEYVKVDGVWKIKTLNYRPFWHGDYAKGWARTEPHAFRPTVTYPEDPFGPDTISDGGYEFFPNTEVFPFHYPHPVTGQTVESEDNEAARQPAAQG